MAPFFVSAASAMVLGDTVNTPMDVLQTQKIGSWDGPFPDGDNRDALGALEKGKILFFPKLPFELHVEERVLLLPSVLEARAKNVSLDSSGKLRHAAVAGGQRDLLQGMMQRFARNAAGLVDGLFPAYRGKLQRARTSFRPAEIEGRRYSPLTDDTRLHVDAFPTTPMHGKRILRLFTNIDPDGRPRLWNIGEPFADMAQKLLSSVRGSFPIKNRLLALVGATKSVRSPYDDLMLGLHNASKLDLEYQRDCPRTTVEFASGATWLCFTDLVMHAALKGRYALEQTFYLDVNAMAEPARAPIRILEVMTGKRLAQQLR